MSVCRVISCIAATIEVDTSLAIWDVQIRMEVDGPQIRDLEVQAFQHLPVTLGQVAHQRQVNQIEDGHHLSEDISRLLRDLVPIDDGNVLHALANHLHQLSVLAALRAGRGWLRVMLVLA